ncbi:Protein of unknown function [Leuconostoc citreum LBAE E16]|nr:Protein of unknown function [Leuconostoc citreum LBAE E16]
MAYFFHV